MQNLLGVKDGDGRESKEGSEGRADMAWEKELIEVLCNQSWTRVFLIIYENDTEQQFLHLENWYEELSKISVYTPYFE